MAVHRSEDQRAITAVVGAALMAVVTLILVAISGSFGRTHVINGDLQPAHMPGQTASNE